MTDYVIKAPSQEAALVAYEALGVINEEGQVMRTGVSNDGATNWALIDQGVCQVPTGNMIEEDDNVFEEMQRLDGYWIVLRWAGESSVPTLPPDFEIIWTSDLDNTVPYPPGVGKFS